MAISTLVGYVNPELAVVPAAGGVLIRLVLVLSAIRILPLIRAAEVRVLWPIWIFAAFAALSSSIVSPAVSISMMKVITFVVGSSTAVVAFSRLSPEQLVSIRSWFVTLVTVMAVLSALTLAKPDIAYHLNGKGLQGVLSHPQALGTLLAPFSAWWVVGALLSRDKPKVMAVAVTGGTLLVMLLTQARTALIATTLAILVATLTRFFGRQRPEQGSASRLVGTLVAGLIGLMLAALLGNSFLSLSKGFLLKRTEDTNVSQAFLDSRGYGIVLEWNNFLSAPLTGHGFGVYADGSFPSGVTTFQGIPISAPVEKGFVPTAVLEETGLPGALLLFFAVYWLGRQVWRSDDLRSIAMFVAALGVNTGEAVILSPGGMGLLVWLIIGFSCFAFRINQQSSARTRPQTNTDNLTSLLTRPAYNIMRTVAFS